MGLLRRRLAFHQVRRGRLEERQSFQPLSPTIDHDLRCKRGFLTVEHKPHFLPVGRVDDGKGSGSELTVEPERLRRMVAAVSTSGFRQVDLV